MLSAIVTPGISSLEIQESRASSFEETFLFCSCEVERLFALELGL